MRRWFSLACAVLVVALGVTLWRRGPSSVPGARSPASRSTRPPNVVVYLVDTLRADHLGLHGYARDTSPVLDRWAAGSVVFDRAYTPCSWTRPSVVSLMTGLDPVSHGVEDRLDVIPDHVRLLGERLKETGYSTFAVVTNPNVLPQWGFGRGFDDFVDLDSTGHGTRADAVSDHVTQSMAELAQHQPFFLYVHVLDPHAPYDPPAPFDTLFPRSPALPPDRSIGHYDGEIAFVDSQFGRIVDSLQALGLDEGTMTVFVADHGEELLDHGSLGHGSTLFEEVVRIPLVIRFPGGVGAGRRVGARASLVDLVPTILGALGQTPPPDLDGHDLAELLGDREPSWADRELFLSLRTTGPEGSVVSGVLAGPHKYLRRSRPDASESLLDIERDPAETEDLSLTQPDTRARLAGLLDAYMARKSSGIHLRLVGDFASDPAECEALLHATGRFVDVSPVRLEEGDGFELSDDGRTLRLRCRLETRSQSLLAGPRLVPDEDGLVFRVSPEDATVAVERLGLVDGRALPLRAGARRELQALPLTFTPTDAAWSVRDVGQLLGDAGSSPEHAVTEAYLGVVRGPATRDEVPAELLERLRALGYVGGTDGGE